MRVSYVISVWAVTLTALVASAGAQGRGGRAAETATLNGEVTVMTVSPRALQVTTADLENWLVSIPTRPEDVVFRGTATPQFLQPGMAVRFHTTFKKTDKRRKEYQTTRPISKLEIISITENSPPGLYPDDGSAEGDHLPGHEDGDDEEGRGEAKEKEAEKKDDERAAGEDLACLVIGILREYKNNKIKVSAGQFPVTAELPETAEVSVDVRHALWVRPGDKIELTARYLPAMRGRAEGQRMTITATSPLAPDETAAKGRRRTRDKKPADALKKANDKLDTKKDPAEETGPDTADGKDEGKAKEKEKDAGK